MQARPASVPLCHVQSKACKAVMGRVRDVKNKIDLSHGGGMWRLTLQRTRIDYNSNSKKKNFYILQSPNPAAHCNISKFLHKKKIFNQKYLYIS